jgi:hypothetical protein
LQKAVHALQVEIDEAKRDKQVAEMTETDYFKQLRERARQITAARDWKSMRRLQAQPPAGSCVPERRLHMRRAHFCCYPGHRSTGGRFGP